MDGFAFDSLSRRISAMTNRRQVIRGLAAGAIGVAGLRRAAMAAPERITICHWNPTTQAYETKVVNPTTVRVHERHPNDVISPDFASDDEHCGGCGNACAEGESCGAGGEPGVCANDPGANECPPYMTTNPTPGENPCWFPCSMGSCLSCESGFCIAQPDGSAGCVVQTSEYDLAWECSTSACATPVQLWDNLSSEQNQPLCGTWQEAGACLVSVATYRLESC